MRRHEYVGDSRHAHRRFSRHPSGAVAIDGIDASGKTTLANELAVSLQAYGRPVIRASIDGFHRPRSERYRRGPTSPGRLLPRCLRLCRPTGSVAHSAWPRWIRRYHRSVFDFRTDRPLNAPQEEAPADAILIVDGVFLLRPELDAFWDYRIFVAVHLRSRYSGPCSAMWPSSAQWRSCGRVTLNATSPDNASTSRRRIHRSGQTLS